LKGLISRPEISLFLNSSGEPYRQDLHCLYCGLPYATLINYQVYLFVSNDGLGEEVMTFGPALSLMCKRCGQRYKLHYKV
jgi:hypothetical protein